MISSRRIVSAVSGVRSWCEASDVNCLSTASRAASRSELRASSAATRSISSTPDGSSRGRTCPAPSCSADAARYTKGCASRLACQAAVTAPAANAPTLPNTTSTTTLIALMYAGQAETETTTPMTGCSSEVSPRSMVAPATGSPEMSCSPSGWFTVTYATMSLPWGWTARSSTDWSTNPASAAERLRS